MADPNPAVPDFWRYYGNKKLSDVDIILAEEQPAETARTAKRKRQEGEQFFGNSVVLSAFSGYCRTKLEDWDDATDTAEQPAASSGSGGSRARHEIQLLVPAGQLEVGRLLVRGMYQQRPDLSGVTQAQLIQLLLLADRFEVPKVQAAASAAFKALPPEQLQWDTVMAVHSLPAGCAELAACQDLFSAVAAKLQHELGDLELVLQHRKSSKAQQLLGLPLAMLKQLLQDVRTRVASENTVFYAVQQWHEHQQQQIKAKYSQQQQRAQQLQSLQQQTQELLQLVRMPHCSQLFITTVVGQWDLAASFFSSYDLMQAITSSTSGAGPRALPGTGADLLPAFKRYPAWLLQARPPSAKTQLTIDWKLPLAQMKEAFERHLASGNAPSLYGRTSVWQGLRVVPRLKFRREDSVVGGAAANNQTLAFYCQVKLGANECRRASFTLTAPGRQRHESLATFTAEFASRGARSFVGLGAVRSWAEAEGVLRTQRLVGSDGCLHLTLAMFDVDCSRRVETCANCASYRRQPEYDYEMSDSEGMYDDEEDFSDDY